MSGYADTRAVARLAGRTRIVVGSVDVTYFRDTPTPMPRYMLTEPFAYGATSIQFPQIHAGYEAGAFGTGDLSWIREGARVTISRVFDSAPEEIDYVGRLISVECYGRVVNIDVGGEFSGPASLLEVPNQMYRSLRDVGRWASLAAASTGLTFDPWFGPDTDIMLTQVGGQTLLAWAQYVNTMSQDANGLQRSMMPTTWGSGTWGFGVKDYTTKHYTAFNDDTRAALQVTRDASEAPNVIYGTGITPEGERITNAKWPHVFAGDTPDYPIAGGTAFGVGTTDADTVNGDGITILYTNLRELGYLAWEVANTGVYTATIAAAVNKLKADAGLTQNGQMTVSAWDALFDNDVVGYTINGAYIAPLAEDPRVREWNRSASGAILGRNSLYDPTILRVERTIDFGAGITKAAMIAYAQGIIARSVSMKNWVGSLRLVGFGVFSGAHDNEVGLTADDIVPYRAIRPGTNIWLPYFDGGTLFHISGCEVDDTGVTLTIDTQARDLLEVRAIAERDVDSRRQPVREWMAQNQTKKPSTAMVAYDEGFGIIDRKRPLKAGQWNKVPVIMGQQGQVGRTRLRMLNDKPECAAMVLTRDKTPTQVFNKVGNPLVISDQSWLEKESVQDWNDDEVILWASGDGKQPGGYSPRRHRDDAGNVTDAPITGRLDDAASWPFIHAAHTAVISYLYVYPDRDTVLQKGRAFWPLIDSAAS